MAIGGLPVANQRENHYNGRMTWFVILSCIMAAMGGLLFGYDIGISGGVTSMEPFLKKFFPEVYRRMQQDSKISNYCKFDSQLLTSFTSSLYVAGFFASFFSSWVTKQFGRKPSILLGGATFLTGAAFGGAASNVYIIILGRVLLGVGIGFANQSVPLYLSEMAPARHRGAINIGFECCVSIGVLVAYLVNFGSEKIKGCWGWRVSLAIAAVPASILTLGALFLPETPSSLIQQRTNGIEKAKLMLQRVRGAYDVQAELDDLVEANSVALTIEHPFKNLLHRQYRPQLIVAIGLPIFQQATGINMIRFYAPILFRSLGLSESTTLLASVVIGVVALMSAFTSMLIVDKVGRRALFIFGGVQMFVAQIVVGSIMASELGDYGAMGKGYAYLVLVLVCIYSAGFSLSWGPLAWLVTSEIFPLEIRSAGQSIVVSVGFLITFIFAQTFTAMLCHFKSGIFFFFGGWLVVMTAFVWYLLPETKDVPMEKMDRVWKEHWFWKRIVGELDEPRKTDLP